MPEEQQPVELRQAMEQFRCRTSEVLHHWEEAVRNTLPSAWHVEALILRDHVPDFLEELAQAVLSGIQYEGVEAGTDVASRVAVTLASSVVSSVEHGAQRAFLTDYSLGQLLHEYRILRKVTFDTLDRDGLLHRNSREILNDAIDRAMELAAVEFTRVQHEALVRSEAQSRLVVENVQDYAIFMVDAGGNVLTWNAGAERLTGYPSDELVGQSFSCLYGPSDEQERLAQAQIAVACDVGWSQGEGAWIRKDGSSFWASVMVTGLRDGYGALTGFGIVARDVTERRHREEEIRRRAEELSILNQHKDDFLAMLAHELRNPLGAVSNAVNVMERSGPEHAAFGRAKQVAKRQIQHQTRLVEDLLETSRLLHGKVQMLLEPLDLTRLVRDTSEDYRSAIDDAHLSLTVDLPPHPVWVSGDATRLAQVLGNLLQNAAKFTPPGGTVNVSLRGGARAILTVKDTGIGLSPSILPLVFEPFTQGDRSRDRSRGGLGLGLALVKGIVELHEGTVAAKSDGLRHGTEFTVVLPAADCPPERAVPSASPEIAHVSRRVLVIEDSYDSAATLQDLLELSGHEVTLASSGPQGLSLAAEFDPEVVLCDIGLPGMSGYEVAQALRRQSAPSLLALVAMTGYGGDEDQKRSRAAGFDTHLTKPLDVDALLGLMAQARA